ncbi:MAG: ATP-grasp domain-containing protein [Planctomycetota bacterium]|jgi:carbamoyl-phosphate synthase large subunit
MNVLLTSVGRRGYLVKYFKQTLAGEGQVWGGDNCAYTPGFAYCDHQVMLPQVTEDHYPQKLLDICDENAIDIVIPLIDPELEALAPYRQEFDKVGVMLLVSPEKTITMASDKYLTYQFAKDNGLGCPKTYITIDEALDRIAAQTITWPVMVKPRKGSASIDIKICHDRLQLEAAFETIDNPMIQELVAGDEYGYDLFGDQSCQPISVFCKKKLAMRAGETDKAVSTNDPVLIDFGKKLLEKMQLFGPADVDVILSPDGPKLLEINPRFGGGYPCAHLAGADFCSKVIAMRKGQSLKPDLNACPDGVCMLKQDEIIQPNWPLQTDG